MTANDIANMVEKEPYHTNLNRITIANFIRQQQAEIEALNRELLRYKSNGEMGYANELYKLGI